jgi:ABC-2 type transport system permease protein
MWTLLAWQDIRQRYRRSRVGQFWLTISMAVQIASIGVLYAALFGQDISSFLPHLALGFIVWGLLSGLILEGCTAFIGAESIIRQARLPLSLHVFRVVSRNVIVFAHNILIFPVLALIFGISPGWAGLLSLPGLAVLCVNGIWAGLSLGLISARFRDVPQIVGSIVQVAFFLTPIIWVAEMLPPGSWVLTLNPFHHFVELVRTPLLGGVPGTTSWFVAGAVTIAGCAITLQLYGRYRQRIPYWV